MKQAKQEETITPGVLFALILVTVMLLGSLGYVFYGNLTQHETVTAEVVDKSVRRNTNLICSKVCIPIFTTTYRIRTPSEAFSTSHALYEKVEIGKRYSFYVTGWPGLRSINKIVE